jgi:AsmA family protein
MRIFWTILAIAGGLVLLVLVGVAIAVWTVDVNQFVAPIQKKVKEATGRDLAIGGVHLSLGLQPKLVLDDVHFGNPPWTKAKDLAVVKHVEVEVALLPLLRRRFEVVRLNLVDPVIALETDIGGKANWEFAAGAPSASVPVPGAAAVLAAFGIASVEIENGSVTYRDNASGAVTRIDIDRFSAQARNTTSPISTEFRGKVDNIPVSLSGILGPLDALVRRSGPYPITIEGKVAGRAMSVATKVRFAEGATTRFEELAVAVGTSKAAGEAVVSTAGPRKKLSLRLTSPSLVLADLKLSPATAAPAKSAEPAKPKGWIFSDEPVSFTGLFGPDVDGDISVGELKLEDGRRLSDVHARFTLRGGQLDAPDLTAKMYGGTLRGALKVNATHPAEPGISVVGQATGLDLPALLATGGLAREVRGGKTDVAIDVTTRGVTPRQWARDANGLFQVVVGPATVVNPKGEADSTLTKLAQAVNPFRTVQSETEIQCVVVRLPLHEGIARVDRSMAAETRELSVSASGTIDLRQETLDLAISPVSRVALPVNIPQLAGLVHVQGALAAPTFAIDTKATAATLAQLGVAIGKGGLSAVGGALAPQSGSDSQGACDAALGRASATHAAAPGKAPATGTATPEAEIGKALGKLLGR